MSEDNHKNEKQEIQELTFKFTKSENHRVVLSNRVFGGLSPTGSLFELNFMREYRELPKEITQTISEGKQIEVSREQPKTIIRENQVTIYVPLDTLLSIRDWFNEKIEELEQKGIIKKGEIDAEERTD